MHIGDLFPRKELPIIDPNAGGSGVQYPETLTKAFNSIKDVDTLITGHHNTTLSMNELKVFADYMREFLNAVRDAKKAGKSVDEVAGSWKMSEKYAGYSVPLPARLKNNVQVIFDELK
jgi:hypothetical protein